MYPLLLWTQISQTNADRTKISVNLCSHLPHCLGQRAVGVRVPKLKIKNPSHLKGERDAFPRGTTLIQHRIQSDKRMKRRYPIIRLHPLLLLARCNGLARTDLLQISEV